MQEYVFKGLYTFKGLCIYTIMLGRRFSWQDRLKLLIGVARCLEFFHTAKQIVIFRDLKTSHILLDEVLNIVVNQSLYILKPLYPESKLIEPCIVR